MNTSENRQFIIFNVSELSAINFNEVLETSQDTVLKSVNNTKTLVKWEGEMPLCVKTLVTKEGPYTYQEILHILETKEWKVINLLVHD
jgi:type II secretory pathway component PulC